jgi:hypothetical protein
VEIRAGEEVSWRGPFDLLFIIWYLVFFEVGAGLGCFLEKKVRLEVDKGLSLG